jgi:hypothetical protein
MAQTSFRRGITWGSLLFVSAILLATAFVAVPAVQAGSPHFVGDITVTRSGNTVTVSGKEAGLGNETQVHIVVTVFAQCINPGDKHPSAANKESFTAEGTFPVQNGKADFKLSVTARIKPSCSPPMTLVFSDVTVCDTTNNICQTFPGPF